MDIDSNFYPSAYRDRASITSPHPLSGVSEPPMAPTGLLSESDSLQSGHVFGDGETDGGPITWTDMKQKLLLELFSFKNWSAILFAFGLVIDYLKQNLSGSQFSTLFIVLGAVYIFARALVDMRGNGTTALVLRAKRTL